VGSQCGSAVTTYYAYYYTERTVVASKATGKILKQREHSQNFVATDDDNARSYIAADGMKKGFKDPRVTLYAVDAVSSDATVEAAVEREKSEENRLTALRAVAGVSGVLGVGLLVGGWILIVRRRKAEQSAIDAITYDDPSLSKDIGRRLRRIAAQHQRQQHRRSGAPNAISTTASRLVPHTAKRMASTTTSGHSIPAGTAPALRPAQSPPPKAPATR